VITCCQAAVTGTLVSRLGRKDDLASLSIVIPAHAGIQSEEEAIKRGLNWIPACAGMTERK